MTPSSRFTCPRLCPAAGGSLRVRGLRTAGIGAVQGGVGREGGLPVLALGGQQPAARVRHRVTAGQELRSPVSAAMTVGRSVLASRLYGSRDSRLPMAQVLVRAAVVRPAPTAAESHLARGARTLARTPVRTRAPA